MIEPLPETSPEHRFDDSSGSDRPRPVPTVRRLAVLEPAAVTRLPWPVNSIIGRERETETLLDLFRNGHARLVTLTGPGGVGKSRLAIHVARLIEDEFLDGVVFVPLAGVGDPSHVMTTIARALGLRDVANRSPADAVTAFLARRSVLLVLDNFEHLVEAGPSLSSLLAQCTDLRILATSRRPLSLYGEQRFSVAPLETPTDDWSVEDMSRSAAVRLFVDRATAVQPSFALTSESTRVVAEICRRLDGLPLAIELAAARAAVMPATALMGRLAVRLPLLVGRYRDVPHRLQTMRGAISWSHDLLEPAEQRLFRRLACFPGDFGLRSAVAIAGAAGDDSEAVLLHIDAMVEVGLLRRLEWFDDEPRFGWLETVREFGLEQLEAAGETAATFSRHAAHVADVAEEARRHLHDADQRIWLDRLDREYANIQGALGWSLESEPETALRICAALWLFWNKRGHQSEGRGWLERALKLAGDAPAELRAEALMGFGSTIAMQGELELATAQFNDALAIWRRLESRAGEARALMLLGNAASQKGNFASAAPVFHRARSLFPGTGQAPWAGVTDTFLGLATAALGDSEGGLALMREGIALLEDIGEVWALAVALGLYGDVLAMQGDMSGAANQYVESIARLTAEGEPWTAVWPLVGLAAVAQETENHASAARLIGVIEARVEINGGMLEPTAAVRFAQTIEQLEESLPISQFERERVAGAALGPEEVVEEARGVLMSIVDAASSDLPSEPDLTDDGASIALTIREREVLVLVAEGLSDKAVAERLFISPRTVANHVNNVLGKLGVGSRSAAVALAIRNRLI